MIWLSMLSIERQRLLRATKRDVVVDLLDLRARRQRLQNATINT